MRQILADVLAVVTTRHYWLSVAIGWLVGVVVLLTWPGAGVLSMFGFTTIVTLIVWLYTYPQTQK